MVVLAVAGGGLPGNDASGKKWPVAAHSRGAATTSGPSRSVRWAAIVAGGNSILFKVAGPGIVATKEVHLISKKILELSNEWIYTTILRSFVVQVFVF